MKLTNNQKLILSDLLTHATEGSQRNSSHAYSALTELRLFTEDIVTKDTYFDGFAEDTVKKWAPKVLETGVIGNA